MTSLDLSTISSSQSSSWISVSLGDNASTDPCSCLPPPPDFDLPPPPLLPIIDISDIDFSKFFSDPIFESCPSTSFDNLISDKDNLKPPGWLNDGEIDVIKTRTDESYGQQPSATVFAVGASAATLLLFLVVFLVAYFCRRKRTTWTLFPCFHIKKQNLHHIQQPDRRNSASLSIVPNRRKSSQSSTVKRENFSNRKMLGQGKDQNENEDGVEIPVGADWTYRRARNVPEINRTENNLHSIYDIPQVDPKPPTIIVTLPDTIQNASSFEHQNPLTRFTIPAPPSTDCIPPAIHRRHCSPSSTSFDNHNPIYEEISLHGESIVDSSGKFLQDSFASDENGTKLGGQNGHYACSDCSGRESGYGTEGCPKNHALKDSGYGRKTGQYFDNQSVNKNSKDDTTTDKKMKTMISPKRPKRYYTNGSLAVSLAEGFDINVQHSAYV